MKSIKREVKNYDLVSKIMEAEKRKLIVDFSNLETLLNEKLPKIVGKEYDKYFQLAYEMSNEDISNYKDIILETEVLGKNKILLCGSYEAKYEFLTSLISDRLLMNKEMKIPVYISKGEKEKITASSIYSSIVNLDYDEFNNVAYATDQEASKLIKAVYINTDKNKYENISFEIPLVSEDKIHVDYNDVFMNEIVWFVDANLGKLTKEDVLAIQDIKSKFQHLEILITNVEGKTIKQLESIKDSIKETVSIESTVLVYSTKSVDDEALREYIEYDMKQFNEFLDKNNAYKRKYLTGTLFKSILEDAVRMLKKDISIEKEVEERILGGIKEVVDEYASIGNKLGIDFFALTI